MDAMTQRLAAEFSLRAEYAENIIRLLDGGCTVPFIARYRKEQHGATDDQTIRAFSERLDYLRRLGERREEAAAAIEERGGLTDELRRALDNAATLAEIEDLYRPFKQKRRTRATVAREKGLEPLAELLFAQQEKKRSPEELAAPFVSAQKGVNSVEEALSGASDILAERISDDAAIRGALRAQLRSRGELVSEGCGGEEGVYGMYCGFRQSVRSLQDHRILAINRGEREGVLRVSIEPDETAALSELKRRLIRPVSTSNLFVAHAAADSWKRLLFPSLERELRTELTDRAAEGAIRNFALNLRPLLMQPPVRGRITLGFDPAYRTGCKLAVVDATGKVLETGVVYPTPPHQKTAEARRILSDMIRRHGVTAIALGNGTASRESELFLAELCREFPGVAYTVVSEAGASVYSASPLGAEEFPEYDVSLRSAVSIARRLQDPLAELVKIDPKSIGVGQYQHDMPQARLDEALGGVVEDCVNAVGVELNTASPSLLSRISGLSAATAKNIVAYRQSNGAFTSRAQLKKVPRLGPKAFEQCAGFLRISGGSSLLDNTGVHPESYRAAETLLKLCGYTLQDAAEGRLSALREKMTQLGEERLAEACGVGLPTLRDMAAELMKPGRDPRDELPAVLLRSDVLELKDLKSGMKLRGTVRNVVDFGAFVDIGVHQDGLVHISRLSTRFLSHPSEAVSVGDVVEVTVLEADVKKGRISLSMID